MSQQVQVEGVGTVEFPDEAKAEEIQQALNQAFPPAKGETTSATGAFGRAAATGVLPGAAFVAGFGAVAPTATGLAAETGPWAPIIGGGAGLIAGTGAAALAAYGQGKLLKSVAPSLYAKLQAKQAADIAQHPIATLGGELAANIPSMEMEIPKLAQIPFRAGVGALVGGVQPLVTQQRAPTASDIAGGAAAATIFGRGRFNLLPRSTLAALAARTGGPADASSIEKTAGVHGDLQPQPVEGAKALPAKEGGAGVQPSAKEVAQGAQVPLTPADQAHIEAERGTVDVPVEIVPEVSDPNQPFAISRTGQFMGINRAKGTIEIYPQEFSRWLNQDVPPERRALAVRSRLAEERNHLAVTPEQALSYWDTLTPLEKLIEQRTYQGPGRWQMRADVTPTDMGFEAIRARFQRYARMSRSEIAESALKERIKLQTLQALEDAVRGVRESLGTSASKEGLAILNHVDDGIQAAKAALAGKEPAAIRRGKEAPQPEFFLPPVEKGAALERAGFPEPTPKLVEAAADQHFASGQPADFDKFFGELQGKFGAGITRQSVYYAWQDALAKKLMAAPGAEVQKMLTDLGLVGDVAKALHPGETDPRMGGAIPDAIDPTKPIQAQFADIAKQFEHRPSKSSAAERYKFAPALRRRYAAIGAIMDHLTAQAGEKPSRPWDRSSVGPEDINQTYVLQSAAEPVVDPKTGQVEDYTQPEVNSKSLFRTFTLEEAKNPVAVGEIATRGASVEASGKGAPPRTVSRNLVKLRDNATGRIILVSAWRDPRSGPKVVNPTDPSAPGQRIDENLLTKFTPQAVIGLRDPVKNFREVFTDQAEFDKRFGEAGIEGTPGLRTSSFVGPQAGIIESQAGLRGAAAPPLAEAGLPPSLTQPEFVSPTATELTTPGRTRPIPVGSPLYRSPRPTPIPAEVLPPEGQRAVAAQAAERFPVGEGVTAPPGLREVLPGLGKPTGEITEVGAPARMGPGWPLRAGIAGTVEGRRTPAALRRFPQAAKDEISAIGEGIKSLVRVHDVVQKESALLDAADATKNNLARQQEVRIRQGSLTGPVGRIEALTGQVKGNKQVLAAANVLVEAGFDRSKVKQFMFQVANGRAKAEALANSNVWYERRKGASWLRACDELQAELNYAAAHWDDPDLQRTATRVVRALDDQLILEKANGYDIAKDDNYLPHRYDAELWNGKSVLFREQRVWGRKFRQARVFDTHYEAIENDAYIPITRDSASLVSHRVRQGLGMITFDRWTEAMKNTMGPNGQPLALQAIPTSTGGWKSPNPHYELVSLGAKRQPIAVQAEFAKPIASLTAPDVIENWGPSRNLLHFTQTLKHTLLIGDFFHLARVMYYGMALAKSFTPGWKGGWSALDIAERDIPEAVRLGALRPKDAAWAAEQIPYGNQTISRRELIRKAYSEMGANLGKVQDALYKDLVTDLTPSAGPIRRGFVRAADPTVGRYNRFLFDGLTRGLMSESIVRQFEAQSAAHPTLNPDNLLRDISRDVNNFFGNIGRQGVFKSKWSQDMARMFFLAPQWVEGLVRKEASTAARLSGAPFRGLTGQREGLAPLGATAGGVATGVLAMIGLTQAINMITRGKPTWENEEKEHRFDAYIPSWGGEKEGFWFSPLAIYMELTHDLYRIIEAKPKVMDAVDQIVANKESPLARATMVLLTGKTPTGELTSTSGGQLASAGKALMPMPITFGRFAQVAGHAAAPTMISAPPVGSVQRQALATFAGMKTEPELTEPQKMGKLAKQFMVDNKLQKDTGWVQVQTDEASYSKLRKALRANDQPEAKKILDQLRETHTDADIVKAMQRYAKAGFTGTRKNEKMFIASLNDQQLEAYSRAIDRKMADLSAFVDFYSSER